MRRTELRSQKDHCGNIPSTETKWGRAGPQKPAGKGKEATATSSRGFLEPLEDKCQEDKSTA